MSLPIPGINGVPYKGGISLQPSGKTPNITDALKNLSGTLTGLTQGNDPSSLAELIERQAANQDAQAQQKSGLTSTDPFAALSQQLFNAANSINVASTPLEQLRKMAESQVSAQYDPQITALGAEINTHKGRAARSEKDAKSMYGALAKDYLSQLPDVTAQYKAQDDATNQRYQDAQQQSRQQYQQNADQQNALLKQLGVQAASPDANNQAATDQAYFQNQSKLEQNSALDQLAAQQGAQSDYTRNLSSNAQMAGANTAQDIANSLSDYLTQANGQMTALTSGKQSAIAALLQQLQSQDAQRVQTQGQQQFDNMMKLYNFQLSAQNDAAKNGGQGGFGTGTGASGLTTGLQGATNYLANQYQNQPILASHLMGMLNDVLSNPDVVKGKYTLDPGNASLGKSPTYSNVGQEYMMNLLRQEFAGKGDQYNNGDINNTMNALLAYLGKLR